MRQNENLSPEIEAVFAEWIHKKGIQVALFDFDDTLIDTNTLFRVQFDAFFNFCSECAPQVDIEALKEDFRKIDAESFQAMGVSPKKWEYIVNKLSGIYQIENMKAGVGFFHEIYTKSPDPFDGICETLDVCQRNGLRLGLVTHASEAWTDIKLDSLNLRNYFEHIKIIDVEEHKFKGAQHWKEAVDMFGVDARRIMAIGDNLRGDIEAAHQVGIETLVWIPSKWHVYSEGDLPDKAVKIDKIHNLIPSLIGQPTSL